MQEIEEDPNNLCILMWDANESIDEPTSSIKKILSEITPVDMFAQVAGDPGSIATNSSRRKRINYIITSQALVQYVSQVGYLGLYESNCSDHQGMFMDISESIIDTKVSLSRHEKRYIGSKSKPEIIYRYKQYIHKQFQIHRIYKQAEEIKKQAENGKTTIELIQRLNNLDKQITEIMLAAEKSQCPKRLETEWSVTIHEQAQLCKYWAIVEKGILNTIDTSKQSREVFIHLSQEIQQEIFRVTDYYHHPTKTRLECR
jgi:hypothetical protein